MMVLVVIAALTIGAGVAWSAVKGSTTPSTTTPSTTPPQTAPGRTQQQHSDPNCPHMGSRSGPSSNTVYSTNM